MANEVNRPRPQEQEAIRTTIVGGRPPGCGKAVGSVPRGVVVLVKKAAVDPEFRSLLLSERGQAARSIGLELSPAESMMLSAVPAAQLRSIIAATTVPQAYMPAFLGKVAAVMLAALGIVQAGCDDNRPKPAGIRPEDLPKDNPAAANRPAEPANDQHITIAGAVIVKPLTPGATLDRPAEVTDLLGIGPDTPLDTLDTPEDSLPIAIVGNWLRSPPARPRMPPPDFTIEPHRATYDIGGMMANKPPAHPDIPTEFTLEPATDRPRRNLTVFGNTGDWTDYSTSRVNPPTRPAIPPIDLTPRPAEAHADNPDPDAFDLMNDRPGPTYIFGMRPESPPSGSVTINGILADRPAVIKGLRVDRPDIPKTAPMTKPTTMPAAQSAQPPESDVPAVVEGIRPDRPGRAE